MRLGIVIGSVREGRFGAQIGAWVEEVARGLDAGGRDVEWEVLDVAAFDLPIMTDEGWAQDEDGPAEVHR